jgi:hypothetical protein
MNDAIALLAISQIICLGAIVYLYAQVQELKTRRASRRGEISPRVHSAGDGPIITRPRSAVRVRVPSAAVEASFRPSAAELAARMGVEGVDISALARRMRKSEEEVRLLLRRQGISR